MDLKRINLNLLVYLDILLNELSVSKAADKSHLSQAAMSGILKQLRNIFEDPLFIREAHGVKPTPKALALHPKIKTFLASAEDVLTRDEFDPLTEVATFNIVLGSHAEMLILSKLSSYLAQHAPFITLKTVWVSENTNLDESLAATVDLAIGADFLPHGIGIIKEFILNEEMACAMSKSNPLAKNELTRELFMAAEHVEIQFIEKVFNDSELNFKRNVKITVSNLISALEVIRDTNYLAVVPRHLAIFLNDKQDFEIKPLPFPNKSFTINMFYHRRFINYKPLQWLLQVIKEHCL